MKRKWIAAVLTVSMVFTLTACGGQTQEQQETSTMGETDVTVSGEPVKETVKGSVQRTAFMDYAPDFDYEIVTEPNVTPYEVREDFSNIINYSEDFSYLDQQPEMKKKLLENGFVVIDGSSSEFFEGYEHNRYSLTPNFVTSDSMLHTYHLYFSHLLKGIEKEYFYNDLKTICEQMITASKEQYEKLSGTGWENAAKRNMAYFTVALKLLDDGVQSDPLVEDIVSQELYLIHEKTQITESPLMNWENPCEQPLKEDYTQYIVRGYYEEDETLSHYFQAMMWFGRISFRQSSEEETRSAVLMTKAMSESDALAAWNRIYDVTTFFIGTSDDPGLYEYAPVMEEVYGDASLESMVKDTGKWETFMTKIKELDPPAVNSIPVYEYEDHEAAINAFRFMGQRETFDAAAMQKLVYQAVKENQNGDKRLLPSAMDIPAVLGSAEAEAILEEQGAFAYEGYGDNLEKLKNTVAGADEDIWKASLYNNWLNTIRPLVAEKGEGYPVFMQNKAWTRKQLNTFLGSFTELKHDSVLYAKQVYAEMGGGEPEDRDFRGYVEPQPEVYAGLAYLSMLTRVGLEKYNLISGEDAENLQLLQELSEKLLVISNKELKSENLTGEEHDLIKTFGGQLEHFWFEALSDGSDTYLNPSEHPSAVVTDIATNPNGTVLEIGTGGVDRILVIVDVEGSLRIAQGFVYSYYEFVQPVEERLTDKEWRIMLGIDYPQKEDGTPDFDAVQEEVEQPEWVNEFKVNWQ